MGEPKISLYDNQALAKLAREYGMTYRHWACEEHGEVACYGPDTPIRYCFYCGKPMTRLEEEK